jgi:hypothetical protein
MMRPRQPLFVLLLLICSVMISCGKKGDPFLPAPEDPGRITGLKAEWTGESVLLTGRIEGEIREGGGIRAYYASYPLDQPPCEGCPIEYQGFESFGREATAGRGFSCLMRPIRPGALYFFEVRVMGPGQRQGPPSNRLRLEVR